MPGHNNALWIRTPQRNNGCTESSNIMKTHSCVQQFQTSFHATNWNVCLQHNYTASSNALRAVTAFPGKHRGKARNIFLEWIWSWGGNHPIFRNGRGNKHNKNNTQIRQKWTEKIIGLCKEQSRPCSRRLPWICEKHKKRECYTT